MNAMIALTLPNGTEVTLPFEGVRSFSDLGRGVPEQVIGAMGVVGMSEAALRYFGLYNRMRHKLESIGGHVKIALIDGEDTPAADVEEIERIRHDMEEAWNPIQCVINAARTAIERTGYDGAPC